MKQATLIAVILGVLVLVSAVQAIQLNDLKTKVSSGQVSAVSSGGSTIDNAKAAGDSSKKTSSLPSNIKDLPQMVGGC